MRVLTLALKREYFDAIKSGTKLEEYRQVNEFWTKRIHDREFDKVVLTLGYPRNDDNERRIERKWNGYKTKSIKHPLFGDDPCIVFAIDVSVPF